MNSFTPKILRYESVPSTNNELARLAAEGADEGTSIVAEEQTAGRGRLQRTWISPKGAGLYFSCLLLPKIPQEQWPIISFLAAIAVNDALLEACGLQTDIKWPNDLLAGERKICGILSEVVESQRGRAVILGIGINLKREAFPDELANVATSVSEATGSKVDREPILAALVQSLTRWYSLLHDEDGPRRILATWESRSSFAEGKRVKVVNGEEMVHGMTRGLESDGALKLELDSGEFMSVRAGDVSVRAEVSTTTR